MKHLLMLLLLLCSASVSAQDVIVKKDGSTIICRVIEVTATEITYKKWKDLKGSNFVMDKSLASGINYEDGRKETFGKVGNLYVPNNHDDGSRQLSDKDLLFMDSQLSTPKCKQYRKMAWIGGGIAVGLGVICLIAAQQDPCEGDSNSYETKLASGLVLTGAGVAWTAGFLLAANKAKKQEMMLQSSSLFQYEFNMSNGSSFFFGADLIRNRVIGYNTVGMGLRYNF